MNSKSEESEFFEGSDLRITQPAIGGNLSVELEQPAISGDLSVELVQPRAVGDDLTQKYIHLLMPPEKNSNQEKLR